MSHDTYIKSVPIWDEPALEAACTDLRAKGINLELRKDSNGRMWGRRTKAGPFVLHLPDCQFDVVFERHKDGYLVPVCDLHGDYIADIIGVENYTSTATTADERQQERGMAAIGQLVECYSQHALRNQVRNDGFTIIDETIDAEGQLQISYQ